MAVLAFAEASPAKDDKLYRNKGCAKVCTTLYEPVCAYDPSDNNRERQFGNNCVFEAHNCQNPTSKSKWNTSRFQWFLIDFIVSFLGRYVKKHDGECKGSGKGGVRLS